MIDTTNVAHKGEFNLKVKATFGNSLNEDILFKVFLMHVTFTLPTVTPIAYKIQDPSSDTTIDKFTLTSDPDPAAFWGSHSLTYDLSLSNYDPFPGSFFVLWDEAGINTSLHSGKVKVQTNNNKEYFQSESADIHMPANGQHSFKLKATSAKGPTAEVDIIVNIEPNIVIPSMNTMVFIIDGTKPTLTTQNFIFEPQSLTLTLLKTDDSGPPVGVTVTNPTPPAGASQITVTLGNHISIVPGQFNMKIKAQIAGYTNENALFDIFIVKIVFTPPTITPHPVPYKVKDSQKTVVIDEFTIGKDPANAPVDLNTETVTYTFQRGDYSSVPVSFFIQLD